jgi:hypothetical protein
MGLEDPGPTAQRTEDEMLSRFMRLLVLSLLVLSLASPGFAARRSSLGGNLLIKDMDEVFFFPQRTSEYNRIVNFDFGSSNGIGSGGMIFGNESIVFGAFAHRSDFIAAIPNAFFTAGDIDNINFGGTNAFNPSGLAGGSLFGAAGPTVGPFQWFDVLLGWEGGGNPWGLRLSVGRNQEEPSADPADDSNVTSVDAVVGVTLRSIDISGEFAIADAKTDVGTTSTDASPSGFSVAARKTATEQSEDLQLGWLGEFSFFSGGSDVTTPTTSSSLDLSDLSFVVGMGPVYTPSERTSVSMYGTFEYRHNTSDDGTTKDTGNDYIIPGWHVAGEVELTSWLQARTGLESRYTIARSKTETAGASDETQEVALNFRWHTGVGISIGNFKIDGYIDPAVITSGTDLFGNSNSLFGMVSTSYSF